MPSRCTFRGVATVSSSRSSSSNDSGIRGSHPPAAQRCGRGLPGLAGAPGGGSPVTTKRPTAQSSWDSVNAGVVTGLPWLPGGM